MQTKQGKIIMKKILLMTATAFALVGCQPQQGTSPSDSGVQSGSSSSTTITNQTTPGTGSSTNTTNSTQSGAQGSSSQQPSQPNQTQPEPK